MTVRGDRGLPSCISILRGRLGAEGDPSCRRERGERRAADVDVVTRERLFEERRDRGLAPRYLVIEAELGLDVVERRRSAGTSLDELDEMEPVFRLNRRAENTGFQSRDGVG